MLVQWLPTFWLDLCVICRVVVLCKQSRSSYLTPTPPLPPPGGTSTDIPMDPHEPIASSPELIPDEPPRPSTAPVVHPDALILPPTPSVQPTSGISPSPRLRG